MVPAILVIILVILAILHEKVGDGGNDNGTVQDHKNVDDDEESGQE